MSATERFVFVCEDAAVAGVDEAGRGPLAGPVVAAAVVLDERCPIEGLRDSKQLLPDERLRLAREVRLKARAFALGYAGPAEIDEVNILRATLLAMERAVLRLRVVPELVRVDGNQLPAFSGRKHSYLLEPVIGGDDLVPAISAASILAKVCRDRLMCRWHRRYPLYGFDRHKGYATRRHLEALELHGPCPIHRRSFAPCVAGLEEEESAEAGAPAAESAAVARARARRKRPGDPKARNGVTARRTSGATRA